jgi:hypothetical protein
MVSLILSQFEVCHIFFYWHIGNYNYSETTGNE